jgi:hypothetical protein
MSVVGFRSHRRHWANGLVQRLSHTVGKSLIGQTRPVNPGDIHYAHHDPQWFRSISFGRLTSNKGSDLNGQAMSNVTGVQ